MPFILVCLALVGLSLVGYGWLLFALCRRFVPVLNPNNTNLGELGLIGMWLVTVLASMLHLALPLGGLTSLCLLLLGWAGLALNWQHTRRAWLRQRLDGRALVPPVLAVTAVAITMQVKGPAFYDTGLYHLQTLLMQADGPLILGAANIHMRFGYNSLLYPLSGAFNLPGLGLATALTINPLLFIFTIAAIASRQAGLLLPVPRRFGALLMAGIAALCLLRGWVSSPLSDIAAALLMAYAAFLLTLLICGRRLYEPGPTALMILSLALSSSLAVAMKLSALPIVLLVLLAYPAAAPTLATPGGRRILWPALLLPAVLGLVWLVRGLLLSGCFAYPLVDSCLQSLPWTVPVETAVRDFAMMQHYARVPDGDITVLSMGWEWLPKWFAYAALPMKLTGALMVCLFLATPFMRWTGTTSARTGFMALAPQVRWMIAAMFMGLLVGVLFWFLSAPLWRYGFCFILPALTLFAAMMLPISDQTAPGRPWSPQLAFIPVGLLLMGAMMGVVRHEESWPKFRDTPVVTVTNHYGVTMRQPQGDDRCWAAAFPCVPEPNSDLHYRAIGPFRAAVVKPSEP
jgi:hypothetical protein